MPDALKIWIDRLADGKTQKIDASFEPSILDAEEKDLVFPSSVTVQGDAYLADSHLIIRLKAATSIKMPCSICNQMISTDLKVENFYHAEALDEIQGAVFDCTEALREALLLELPQYVECNGGKCPERALMAPYMRKEDNPGEKGKDQSHFPFSGL